MGKYVEEVPRGSLFSLIFNFANPSFAILDPIPAIPLYSGYLELKSFEFIYVEQFFISSL